MSTCLVFGAYGLLGSSLCSRLAERGYAVLRQGRSPSAQVSIDPLDADALSAVLGQRKIDAVVNLIAATNVDECEADTQSAYRGNVQVVEALVRAIEIDPETRHPIWCNYRPIRFTTDQVRTKNERLPRLTSMVCRNSPANLLLRESAQR